MPRVSDIAANLLDYLGAHCGVARGRMEQQKVAKEDRVERGWLALIRGVRKMTHSLPGDGLGAREISGLVSSAAPGQEHVGADHAALVVAPQRLVQRAVTAYLVPEQTGGGRVVVAALVEGREHP